MSEPVAQASKAVNLVDERTGEVVNVDEKDLPSLGGGYRAATPEEVQHDLDRQQHGEGFGNELAAGLEGAASGATLGLSDLAAKYMAPEYAEGLAKRREFNPTAAGIGEAGGIIGSALLTGGESLLAKGAAAATSPARAVMSLGELATRGAERLVAKEGAGVLGSAVRAGLSTAAGGAVEGALFGAAKRATDDFLTDKQITAERIIAGAKHGALTGATLGGVTGAGLALGESGVKSLWPKVEKAIGESGSFDDFVGERAYKAALGGRNLRDVQRSERYGGPADIGNTLLREGVVTPGSTIDDIAKAAGERANDYGTRIGSIVDELDAPAEGLGHVTAVRPDGRAAWSRIESEVLAPLKASPVKRDIGEAIEGKLGYLKDALTREDAPPLKFRDLWELRRDLDDRLRWEQPPAPYAAPNPAIEGLRDVRRTLDEYWQDIGDAAAEASGRPGLMEEFRAAKRNYSQLKHAEEISTKAIARDSANRMLSPSDYGFGAVVAGADALTGGGASLGTLAYGLASGAVHKFFRERGSAMFAGSMYAMRGAPKIVIDARAGEAAAEAASKGIVQRLADGLPSAISRMSNGVFAGATRALASPESYENAVKAVQEYASPGSPRREEMRRQAAAVRVHDPDLANALEQHTQNIADFLASKAGELTAQPKAGDPFGHLRTPRHDLAAGAKLARYVLAATDPQGALKRIADGQIAREDVEALRTLYPRMYQNMVADIQSDMGKVQKLPPYEARVALSHLLGTPMDPSMQPERIALMQQVIKSGAYSQAKDQQDGALPASKRRPPKVSSLYETSTERAQKL